jgi:hypothetical protein
VRVSYRARQLWRTVTSQALSPAALADIRTVLSDEEFALFLRYDLTDQQHCYRVMCALRDQGADDPDLLAAALLHDIGKSVVTLSSLDRVVGTLAERGWRGSLARWGNEPPEGWRRPFAVRVQHAAWGAQLAKGAGSNPTVVALIGHHQDCDTNGLSEREAVLLRLLQTADEQN